MLGVVGFLLVLDSPEWSSTTYGIWSFQALVRIIAAGLLIVAGFEDRRTLMFGTVTLLTAVAYCREGVGYLATQTDSFLITFFSVLPIDAFLPYYLWRFARMFPEAFVSRRFNIGLDWAERFALLVGLFLVLANVALLQYPDSSFLTIFHFNNQPSIFGTLVYGITIPAFFVIFFKMRIAKEEERRRVSVFIMALLATVIPLLLFIVATAVSERLTEFVLRPDVYVFIIPLVQSFAVATPIITTYAVLVERILPVRILLKQTIRYTLAHGFIFIGLALPIGLFFYYLYTLRALSISAIIEDYNLIFLVIAFGISAYLYSKRNVAYHYFDEIFYRAQYNASEVLPVFNSTLQGADSLVDISSATRNTIDQTLHSDNVHLLFIQNDAVLIDPRKAVAQLPLNSPFGEKLLSAERLIDLSNLDIAMTNAERQWANQTEVKILIPIHTRQLTSGYIILGEKKSELPYTKSDFDFLELLSNTISVAYHYLDENSRQQFTDTEHGFLCTECGEVFVENTKCFNCNSTALEQTWLPMTLHGHLTLQRAIGFGGMGAVYMAEDLKLHRQVVLKSMNSANTQESRYLRKEARLMAKQKHAHIATIYDYESYNSMPILVCEYLENGTLSDLISSRKLSRSEIVDIMRKVSSALRYLHRQGIVHGDIKPSNIGFDAEDTPKLLDFGLARQVADPGTNDAEQSVSGTYAYMSPELIRNWPTDHRADLWALAVTMFEAMYGQNPFLGKSFYETYGRILNSVNSVRNAVPSPHQLFEIAFATDIKKRPQSANHFISLIDSFKEGSE